MSLFLVGLLVGNTVEWENVDWRHKGEWTFVSFFIKLLKTNEKGLHTMKEFCEEVIKLVEPKLKYQGKYEVEILDEPLLKDGEPILKNIFELLTTEVSKF